MTTELLLHEEFAGKALDPRLTWFCPPGRWSIDSSRRVLVVAPDAETDFWQKTHCGLRADDGHFLFAPVEGDLVLTTRVRFSPVHQYDQAGLMIRVSPSCWLKTSVEYEPDGPSQLGAVVTNGGYSDWSTQPFPTGRSEIWLRVRREGGDQIVEASEQGHAWMHLRTAHLHDDRPGAPIDCGLYACSPKGGGFEAEFEFLEIETGRIEDA